MNRTHALVALLLALPVAAHAEDWWVDPSSPTEVTVSGGLHQDYLLLPEIAVTQVLDQQKVIEVALAAIPPLPMGYGLNLSGHVMGGLNFRVAGARSPRRDAAIDLRLLGGVAFSYQPGGWLRVPLIGPAGAGELALTAWATEDFALTLGLMAGVQLAYFVMPIPVARASVGLTF